MGAVTQSAFAASLPINILLSATVKGRFFTISNKKGKFADPQAKYYNMGYGMITITDDYTVFR